MAGTGEGSIPGTAEHALAVRVAHALHAPSPLIGDAGGLRLLHPDLRARVEDPASYRDELGPAAPGNSWFVASVGVASLLAAEEAAERGAADGIDQYVILGAGFDTFGFRRQDLAASMRVFEVDQPDVQALKFERVAASGWTVEHPPVPVPVDFEVDRLDDALAGAGFDRGRRAVVSWVNTIPYLSEEATASTLGVLGDLSAPGSVLVCNYPCAVELTASQRELLAGLRSSTAARGEPQRSRWRPDEFVALLDRHGFVVDRHLTEHDLTDRWFRGRDDGIAPGVPARVIEARRRDPGA